MTDSDVPLPKPLSFGLKLLFFTISLTQIFSFQTTGHQTPGQVLKTAHAVRIEKVPPKIDGRLDDAVWETATINDDLVQREPDEGQPPTERTTFQIAYDDHALYVAVTCYDSEPDKIVARLTRRDQVYSSDWVSLNFDPHHDHRSGCWFQVNAAGVLDDGVYANDYRRDTTWDAVWQAKTDINDQGWCVEYKIPYHVLRFSPQDQYTWGLNISRSISRKNERISWVLIRRYVRGNVEFWGHLEGIENINPPRHLELIPYGMGRVISESDEPLDPFGNAGLDLRYGITPSISLNATFNPDFGQVEADPAQLNLSAYEDQFRERRPFFVEGASIFSNSDYDLFYSRRIGKRPGHFSVPSEVEVLSQPDATTILGAVKVSGKLPGRTNIGILNAVTSPEHAKIKRGDQEEKFLIEPLTNYFVGRLKQDFGKNSWVGGMVTAVNRVDAESAYVQMVDWDWKINDNAYLLSGMMGLSQTEKRGFLGHIEIDKNKGILRGQTHLAVINPDFDYTDLGFQRRSGQGRVDSTTYFRLIRETPWWVLRSGYIGMMFRRNWNYQMMPISRYQELWLSGELSNLWDGYISVGRSLPDYDVSREVTTIDPAGWYLSGRLYTNRNKMVTVGLRPSFSISDDGFSSRWRLSSDIEIKGRSNVVFGLEPSYSHRTSYAQWVGVVKDQADQDRFIYGELDSRTIDLTTRASISFAPNLSFQLYLQPYLAVGDFENFKALVAPKTYEFSLFDLGENRDFHRRSLRGNAVLRWEFQPGSTLFVVWSQNRNGKRDRPAAEDLDNRAVSSILDTFSDAGSNIFLVKLNYWLGI